LVSGGGGGGGGGGGVLGRGGGVDAGLGGARGVYSWANDKLVLLFSLADYLIQCTPYPRMLQKYLRFRPIPEWTQIACFLSK